MWNFGRIFLFLSNLLFRFSYCYDAKDPRVDHHHLQEDGKNYFQIEGPRRPIILLPGLGGSILEFSYDSSKSQFSKLWLNIFNLFPFLGPSSFRRDFNIVFDELENSFNNAEGIYEVRPRDFGGVEGVEHLTKIFKFLSIYLHKTVEFFVNEHAYTKGKDLRAAPYDFRKSEKEWASEGGAFEMLRGLIEETYEINNQTQVALIGHSLGGPFAVRFLNSFVDQRWKDKYVSHLFSVAGSFDGSPETLPIMLTGWYSGFPVHLSDLGTRLGGLLMSLPRHFHKNQTLLYTNERKYSYDEVGQIFTDLGKENSRKALKQVRKSLFLGKPPGVSTHCIRGYGFKTPKSIRMETLESRSYKIVDFFDDGDGTLPSSTYRFCESWRGQKEPVSIYNFKGDYFSRRKSSEVKDYHRNIIHDGDVLSTILKVMYDRMSPI